MQLHEISPAGGGRVDIIDHSWNAEVSSIAQRLGFWFDPAIAGG
jgi:hypothetical protein